MSRLDEVRDELRRAPRTWLVTGAAGFIGSHLVEELLRLEQTVVGLDDFSTGSRANLAEVEAGVGRERWARFRFEQGDIRDARACRRACAGATFVLHQAALGSVPRSLADPLASHSVNVEGFLEVLQAARDARCERLVHASSSSVHGDRGDGPRPLSHGGAPRSPYAATKRIDEIYAATWARAYGLPVVGLRYFNVFGPRQDPAGPYAAVVPRWIDAFLRGATPRLFGDGTTSRDFCPVPNVVQANLLAAAAPATVCGGAFDIALGGRTTLAGLFELVRDGLASRGVACAPRPRYERFRPGDVRHSRAELAPARELLGYEPTVHLVAGLERTLDWHRDRAYSKMSR